METANGKENGINRTPLTHACAFFFNLMNNSESQPRHCTTERSFHVLVCVKCSLYFSFLRGGWKVLVIGSSREKKSLIKTQNYGRSILFLLSPLPFLILKTFQTYVYSLGRWIELTQTSVVPFCVVGFWFVCT